MALFFFGQLIRENNKSLDKTYIYSYNGIGNIDSIKAYSYTTAQTPSGTPSSTTFSYTGDKLTGFNGKSITYNSNGGIDTYDGKTFTWNKGKLSRIKHNLGSTAKAVNLPSIQPSKTYSYTYNAFGQRVSASYTYFYTSGTLSPIQSGEVTNYTKKFFYDQFGRLISESNSKTLYDQGESNYTIVYLYDESSMVGFEYTSPEGTKVYYYLRNLRGDVIAIYDTSGNKVVEYAYDAWGNCTIASGTTNYNLAHANPIRYRGYYYDEDTKLYYLNARYYSPEFRRFISPDDTSYLDPETPNGLNLYCYCNNDPVNYVDPSGHLAFWAAVLIGVGILGLFGLGATIHADIADDGKAFNGSIGADAYIWNTLVTGSIGGLIAGLAFVLAPAIGGFLGGSFTLGSYALASAEIAAVTISGAEIVGGVILTSGIGLSYFAYERKKAAPRIRSSTRKQAYDKAFYKGGKKKPIYHKGKYGSHFHPADPRFEHWHYYFAFLLGIFGIDLDDLEY